MQFDSIAVRLERAEICHRHNFTLKAEVEPEPSICGWLLAGFALTS
jgi:hypothetical protein